jgi:hypothetical protein
MRLIECNFNSDGGHSCPCEMGANWTVRAGRYRWGRLVGKFTATSRAWAIAAMSSSRVFDHFVVGARSRSPTGSAEGRQGRGQHVMNIVNRYGVSAKWTRPARRRGPAPVVTGHEYTRSLSCHEVLAGSIGSTPSCSPTPPRSEAALPRPRGDAPLEPLPVWSVVPSR